MLTVVPEDNTPENGSTARPSLIDEIVREGARRMLAAALEAEVDAYIAELAGERDDRGRRLVVRNGHAQPRQVMTAAGAVEATAPRVNDRRVDADTGERKRFSSAILPPWCRRSPKIAEVLPLLYLHGLSSGDFVPALEQFLGSGAGLSAPVLAVGDGALGFWAALREVFPATAEQRCWVHRTANVLGALPKSAHPGAKTFAAAYETKFPKTIAKIVDDLDMLLAFYDYPAEHWVHLRTTNPIESTFATVRHRTRVTQGPGSRAAGLAMAFKLIEAAQARWRTVNAPHLVALVRAGAVLEAGQLVERPQARAA
ncbi:transposase [Frankia sp. AgPm24]|uniref:transposase n=1 Tax=Frankia sp. AgPm24 TaxID=631128 RepID=UPI00200EFE89|nr:transposase [Frankia sp. AgPm24]MCK9925331.1 transposase [Frankia sp. AgPm24]